MRPVWRDAIRLVGQLKSLAVRRAVALALSKVLTRLHIETLSRDPRHYPTADGRDAETTSAAF
jgi:hypothetical protein